MNYKMGDIIKFMHGEEELKGIVNGEVIEKYVPVHVHDGNRNIMVHPDNILENEEDSIAWVWNNQTKKG